MKKDQFAHYRLGFDEVDNDHWLQMQLIEKAKIAAKSLNKNVLIETIQELKNVTFEHYSKEEAFMEKINYPFFKFHKENHDKLLMQINDILLSAKSSNQHKISFHHNLMNELEKIICRHIDDHDMQIASFLKSK